VALFDIAKAEAQFTPGVYLTDERTLWRILDLPEQARKGELPLEDCRFPEAPPVWRQVRWLTERKARVIKR
jgi:hypothetical protein